MRLLVAVLLVLSTKSAFAMCDLGEVIGYTLVFGKTVEAYIQDGKRVSGFVGCARDMVLVFTDNTGVRCKETFVHTANLPKAYLFARSPNDMKLCVDDDMYEVAQPQ
jgi:hypothetical protein